MVLQQPQHGPSSTSSRHLRIISPNKDETIYESFGDLLAAWRRRTRLTQAKLAIVLAPSFNEVGVQHLTPKTYGNLEREERFPSFDELMPLLRGFIEICELLPTISELRQYLDLARERIESCTKQHVEPDQWQNLENAIQDLVGNNLFSQQLEAEEIQEKEAKKEERRRTLSQLDQDISHVIGRDDYCTHLLSFLIQSNQPRKKVVTISAMTGIGKSSVFKLLHKRLLASQDESASEVIACEFRADRQETSPTPQEWFDRFLAHVYNALEPRQKEMTSLPPVGKRLQKTLQAIGNHHKPLVILLDDAQHLIERNGDWCHEWKQFLRDFMTSSDHQATLYVATREWPIWQERETTSYLHHEELPTISAETGIQLWHHLGFSQEHEEILKTATEICGYNPRYMELVAQSASTPDFVFDWNDDLFQGGLSRFVEHPHLAGITPLLEDIIGKTLSDEAKRLLKILALAPVPLPPALILYIAPHAKQHIHELVRTSLLAKRPDRLLLLPLVAESVIEHISREERESLEQPLIDAYQHWLTAGKFHDEAEQASVAAELLLLYYHQHHLMDAADLLVQSGWLCYQFGHGARLARVCQDVLAHYNWRQSPQQELAAHILYDRLSAFRGEKVATAERAKRYQAFYQQAQTAGIQLPASIIVHLLQFIIFHLADAEDTESYQEAESLIESHLDQVVSLKSHDPLTYSSFLYCQAYLYGRWGEYELQQHQTDHTQAKKLLEDAVQLFKECIDLLKESERGAPPLQRSRATFKRARRLNNYAYYAKMIGSDQLSIEQALRESISLKKRGYASPGSLAIAYGEYAQYLMSIGHYQEAFEQSDQSLQEADRLVQSGYPEAESEYAVLQVERGELHLLVGDVDQAKLLFSLAKAHLVDAERRKIYLRKAEFGLQTIAQLETTLHRKKGESLRGQLDHRWLYRYKQIADYDTFDWLAQSGPFTPEEQEQWNKLRENGKIEELKQLMQKTLQREIDIALSEQRAPSIHYPAIPIVIVEQKINDCFALKREIDKEEPNRIVKQFYLDVLDEQIVTLSMIQATHEEDIEAFATYNRRLFTIPTTDEMDIAISQLLNVIDQGLRQAETEALSTHILKTLQKYALVPSHYQAREQKQKEKLSLSPLLQQLQQEQATIPVNVAAQFLESQMHAYGFVEWKVKVDHNAINEFVEGNTEELVLPAKDLTPKSLHSVFAHEVECHVLRHANGTRSKLALLGPGLMGYSPIEEALAVHYTALAQGKEASVSWLGTLLVGLASGISNIPGKTIHPFTFYELYRLLRDYQMLKQLQQGKEEKLAQANAHRFAQNTCLRIWRGVPAPFTPGICSVKDNTYLHGKLQLDQYLEQHEVNATLEQLSVGCISIEHLPGCYQLGMTKPVIPNKQLAMQETFIQAILDLTNFS
jgi:hypothetical protein